MSIPCRPRCSMRWRLILIGVYPDYWMAFTYSDSLSWRIPRTTIHSTNQAFNAWFECLRRSFNPLIVYPPPLSSDGSSWIAWTLIEWRIAVYSICIPMDELLVTSWIHTPNRHSVSFFLLLLFDVVCGIRIFVRLMDSILSMFMFVLVISSRAKRIW